MTTLIKLREFERRSRREFPSEALARLERFDRALTDSARSTVLDWSLADDIRATSWVGVLQVPGLSIEILPKLESTGAANDDQSTRALSRRNLLYMLAVAGNMPFSERDLAGQESVRDSLLEVLITAFVRRLQAEMRRGVDHEYQDVQENCPYLRGKLQVVEHIRKNIAHRERFAVRYSVFGTDTRINRILKASCARLHHLTSSLRNRTALSHVMQLFEPVEDAPVSPTEFQRIVYTRSSERFRPLIDFCRLLSTGQSPTLSGGTATQTFSLLFPMERVFEAFVSRFAVRHAQRLGLRSEHIHVQAHRRTRHLLRDERGRPIYRLEPDLLIDGPDGPVVLDTKWKRLDALSRVTSVRPSQADIYQLHAYATRYGATRTILLFPRVPDASPRAWTMEGNPQQHLLVRFLDLSHDLRTHSEILLQTLAEAIHGAEVLVDNA